MRKSILFAFYALFASVQISIPIPVVAHEVDSPELVRSLSRTTIIVRDIEVSLGLFRDILGMNVRTDLNLEGPAVNTLLGTTQENMRIVILNVDDSEIGNVALLAYANEGQNMEPVEPYEASVSVGQVVLVMETTDIDLIETRARQGGYPVISPPMVIFDRPDMATQSREMIFIGPDGIAINLIQRGTPRRAN